MSKARQIYTSESFDYAEHKFVVQFNQQLTYKSRFKPTASIDKSKVGDGVLDKGEIAVKGKPQSYVENTFSQLWDKGIKRLSRIHQKREAMGVFFYIAFHLKQNSIKIYLSPRAIADFIGYSSTASVVNGLKKLVEEGVIDKDPKEKKAGHYIVNLCYIYKGSGKAFNYKYNGVEKSRNKRIADAERRVAKIHLSRLVGSLLDSVSKKSKK